MTESDVTRILSSLARVEAEIKGLRRDDDGATKRLDAHSTRIDKLERIAYIALGFSIAAGLPQAVALIP